MKQARGKHVSINVNATAVQMTPSGSLAVAGEREAYKIYISKDMLHELKWGYKLNSSR